MHYTFSVAREDSARAGSRSKSDFIRQANQLQICSGDGRLFGPAAEDGSPVGDDAAGCSWWQEHDLGTSWVYTGVLLSEPLLQ